MGTPPYQIDWLLRPPGEAMSHHDQLPRLLVSVNEAARVLGISRSYAYELVAAGILVPVRLGRRVLIPIGAIEELVAKATSDHND